MFIYPDRHYITNGVMCNDVAPQAKYTGMLMLAVLCNAVNFGTVLLEDGTRSRSQGQ
jgi:hypothetical protein